MHRACCSGEKIPFSPVKKLILLLTVLATMAAFASSASAHALQPGFLELRLLQPDQYSVLWKKPAQRGKPMPISVVLPEHCEQPTPPEAVWNGSAYLSRWTTSCPGGLEGGEIRVDGLDQTATDVLIRFDFTDGTAQSHRLTAGDPSFIVPFIPSSFEVVRTYLILGFKHILAGIDHLSFVLALLILVSGAGLLIKTVTAFTLAHSITLAAATLGFVKIPGPPVEATIALSIMFVASEIMHSRAGHPGITKKYPWLVAFIFGLLHGLGFAGALSEIGLPQASIPTALLFFNVGVELGQLFFIGSVFLLLGVARSLVQRYRIPILPWAAAVPPYIIGSAAAFWTIQRLVSF